MKCRYSTWRGRVKSGKKIVHGGLEILVEAQTITIRDGNRFSAFIGGPGDHLDERYVHCIAKDGEHARIEPGANFPDRFVGPEDSPVEGGSALPLVRVGQGDFTRDLDEEDVR